MCRTIHPRCRCTISAVVESGKRTAKVAGKNIKVPADLSYRKWKKDVEREQAALQDAENLAKIRKAAALNGNILTGGLSQALPVKYVEAVIEQVKAAPENIRILWNLAQADMKILDINYQGTAHYSQEEKGIYFHLQQDISAILQKPYRTLFHEMGHLIDNWLEGFNGYCSVNFEGGLLGKTLKEEAEEYINALIKSRQLKNLSEAYYLISAELIVVPNAEQREVSDIWHGATNGKIHGRYGHNRKNYWTENQGENLPKEAFAHMFCSAIQNLEASIQIKKYFPNSYAIFEEIIRQCVKGA